MEQASSPPAQVFAEMVAAVNAGDAARYARLYAQDAVITIHGAGVLTGRPAIEQHEVDLLRQFPGARFAIGEVWQQGETTVAHYAVQCPVPGGKRVGHEGFLFHRFDAAGRIAAEQRYFDGLTPMAQLGLLGAGPARPVPALASTITRRAATPSAVEDEHAALVRASVAAWDQRDEAAFVATLADQVVLDELFLPEPFVGTQAARMWFDLWTQAVPESSTELTTVLAVGEDVLLESVVRGRFIGPLGHVPAGDRAFVVHRAAIVRVEHGHITRVQGFVNGKEFGQPAATGRS